jgi:acarbose 7IV-phosphotransferase
MGRVLACGAVSWNTMIRVDDFPAPEPASIFPPAWHETIGSSGAGKSMNLARLGVDVTLRTLVGDDDEGRRIRTRLERAGVSLSAVVDPTGSGRHVNLMDAAGAGSRSCSTPATRPSAMRDGRRRARRRGG